MCTISTEYPKLKRCEYAIFAVSQCSMEEKTVRLGTRGSRLALWQANHVKDRLEASGIQVEIKIIKTRGDQIQHLGFDKMEGKGFFTKEIEDALLNNDIDFAVHSMKDLSTEMPDGLSITAISERAAPQDILIYKKEVATNTGVIKLKEGATIGTSSVRRVVQIKTIIPSVQTVDIRGNVPTRIQKMRDNENLDGIILAKAGIDRLEIDLSDFEVFEFNPREFVPAPAQGVLAYQARTEDIDTRRILHRLHSPSTLETIQVERNVLKKLDGGCQTPVGIYCEKDTHENFHCFIAYAGTVDSPVQYGRLSQSTHHLLADRILKQINI